MARFEKSSDKRSKGGNQRRGSGRRESDDRSYDSPKRSFSDGPRDRFPRMNSGRDFKRNSSTRRDSEMTKVTCSSCGEKCEVPFKPTSDKPLFCNDCFKKDSRGSSERSSDRKPNKDLEIINEKLDKIMVALKIE